MMLKSLDDLTTQGSIDITLGTQHQDLGMTDGFVSTAITIITTARTLILPDVLHPYVAQVCCHDIDFTYPRLNLHLNGRTPIAPRLMYPHQHVDPECHHLKQNLIAYPPTTLHAQEHYQDLSKHPVNNKLLMSYSDPINNKFLMIYSELINQTGLNDADIHTKCTPSAAFVNNKKQMGFHCPTDQPPSTPTGSE